MTRTAAAHWRMDKPSVHSGQPAIQQRKNDMHIDIRPRNTRLSHTHRQDMAQRLRAVFSQLAHLIVRIVVLVGEVPRSGPAARECTVEVHLPNGQITTINERQRKLGALLRRATERAWKAAIAGIERQRKRQQPLQLPARSKGGPT
jgi:hypothetical protein